MIPKVIHYCWFGGNPLPEDARKCIASWRRFFPDYEIKEWNESNFDVHMAPFVYEAYKLKKWAFVSDYARFWILYHYGGLYFDTDVEVLRDMTPIINDGPFMGCEKEWHTPGMRIAAGLGLGALPKMKVYEDFLNIYNRMHIIMPRGTVCLRTVVDIVTDYFKKLGLEKCQNKIEIAGIFIYPHDYFCPMNYGSRKIEITDNTYTIHHYQGSWLKPHSLEIIEESFWAFFRQKNHQVLWRIRNMIIRYSYSIRFI